MVSFPLTPWGGRDVSILGLRVLLAPWCVPLVPWRVPGVCASQLVEPGLCQRAQPLCQRPACPRLLFPIPALVPPAASGPCPELRRTPELHSRHILDFKCLRPKSSLWSFCKGLFGSSFLEKAYPNFVIYFPNIYLCYK